MRYLPLTLGSRISTTHEDHGEPIELTHAARTLPMYLIGKPDMGKSTLMLHCINQDIKAGHGFVLIEPDANLFYRTLALIPPERMQDVVAIDYGDHEHPIASNPVAGFHTKEYEHIRPKIVESLMATTRKLWQDNIGTGRMQLVFTHTYYTLIENPHTTLLSAARLFQDDSYLDHLIKNVENFHTRAFWNDYKGRSRHQRKEIGDPITFRLQQLYANPHISNILCQPKNTLDLSKHIQNGGILLVNLNRTENDDAIQLLGSLLFARLYHTARHLGSDTAPFTFYLDDFTEYALPVLPETFSQSPQMRFVLAHQHSGQLDNYQNLQKAIRGSVGTLVAFQVSDADAVPLDRELGIKRDGSDSATHPLTHLPPRTALVKLLDHVAVNAHDTHYVYMQTHPPPHADMGLTDAILKNTRLIYATKRDTVEQYIKEWYGTAADKLESFDGNYEFE